MNENDYQPRKTITRMNKRVLISIAVILIMATAACSAIPSIGAIGTRLQNNNSTVTTGNTQTIQDVIPTATPAPVQAAPANTGSTLTLLEAYQTALTNVYAKVNPSVVNIHVIEGAASSGSQSGQGSPFGGSPFGNAQPPQGEALGSGFVWDTQGHIVTNNHVVSGATSIDVTFADGTNVPATVVGTDPDSDLAVIKVDVAASMLKPVELADSKQVKVGEIAIAIGNPFGLQGSMTTGIVSALGREISATNANTTGPQFSIPDIIQTDAPINPGNSGGVLVNDQGQVIGVTAAIESSSNSNSGIGFAIPGATVQQVIPTLIQTGHFDHSYLGMSGTNMTPAIAKAMNLKPDTRGALVEEVVSGGPADKAGLRGSTANSNNAQSIPVGGDVITGINGQPIKSMDDLIAYLASNTRPGDKVTLTILRDGKQQTVDVNLTARPSNATQSSVNPFSGSGQGGQTNPTGPVYLGISGLDLNADINQAIQLPSDQQGVLIEQVQPKSPAANAGLRASSTSATVGGQQIQVGGDVIVAIDNIQITSSSDLQNALSQLQPGQKAMLTIIRDGKAQHVTVTLEARPSTTQ